MPARWLSVARPTLTFCFCLLWWCGPVDLGGGEGVEESDLTRFVNVFVGDRLWDGGVGSLWVLVL